MSRFEKLVLEALAATIRLALPESIRGYERDALKLAEKLDAAVGEDTTHYVIMAETETGVGPVAVAHDQEEAEKKTSYWNKFATRVWYVTVIEEAAG